MLKKILFLVTLISAINQATLSQENNGGFDVNKMFFGGTIVFDLGFGSNSQFTLGANPELGYSIFKNIDLGICGNYIYNNQSFFDSRGTQVTRLTQTGLGLFGRLHITDGFFVQAQPEFNNVNYKQFFREQPSITADGTVKSTSFLVGAGFGSHNVGNANFFTVILIDLNKDLYSPYRTFGGVIIPVIRGGFNIYFNRKKRS